jgi:hypothetical protein
MAAVGVCGECRGSGLCPDCNGDPETYQEEMGEECPTCGGTEECFFCQGTGVED